MLTVSTQKHLIAFNGQNLIGRYIGLQLKGPVYYIGVSRLFLPRYQYHSRACVRQNADAVRLAEKPHSLRPPAHGANRTSGRPISDVHVPTPVIEIDQRIMWKCHQCLMALLCFLPFRTQGNKTVYVSVQSCIRHWNLDSSTFHPSFLLEDKLPPSMASSQVRLPVLPGNWHP